MSQLAEQIVHAVLEDLHNRKGVGDELDMIDSDVYDSLEEDLYEAVDGVIEEHRQAGVLR